MHSFKVWVFEAESVAQSDLEFSVLLRLAWTDYILPASVSQAVGLQVGATTPSLKFSISSPASSNFASLSDSSRLQVLSYVASPLFHMMIYRKFMNDSKRLVLMRYCVDFLVLTDLAKGKGCGKRLQDVLFCSQSFTLVLLSTGLWRVNKISLLL